MIIVILEGRIEISSSEAFHELIFKPEVVILEESDIAFEFCILLFDKFVLPGQFKELFMQIGLSLRLLWAILMDWVYLLLELMFEKVSFSLAILIRVVGITSEVSNGCVAFWGDFRFLIRVHKRRMRLQNIFVIDLAQLLVF